MFYTNLPLVARELFNYDNTNVGLLTGIVALAGFISITFGSTIDFSGRIEFYY